MRIDRVFGAPVQSGDQTVITASEVVLGLGMGMGLGMGSGSSPVMDTEGGATGTGQGSGGGGGGGGMSRGRPVAAIVMGPEGVRVEPILDLTQVALAFFTMFGTMIIMMGRMRRAMRRSR